jgi:HAD superfamily hydrolase (TIGR01458 family)
LRGFLIDLDGTLYTDRGAVPGAVETVAELRRRQVPFLFVTNTTRRSRRRLVERLASYGFQVSAEEMLTAVVAGARLLKERGYRRIAPFVSPDTLEDLGEFDLVGPLGRSEGAKDGKPEAVVLGDLGSAWTAALLNQAFRYVLDGAELVALQKDRYWLGPTGLELDVGPYVAAIEYATNRQATVCGKPEPGFYRAAVELLGVSGREVAMVGDDLWGDVQGAQRAGLAGWLVRTGKFREDVLRESGVVPDRILDSVARILEETG